MSWILEQLSRLVTARPVVTLVVLLAVTVGLGSGATRLAPPADDTALLPEDSRVAGAGDRIEALFGNSDDTVAVTLIFEGDAALTPEGLAQIDAAVNRAASDGRVAPLLARTNPVLGPTLILAGALGTNDFASLSQQQIDEAAGLLPLDRLVGTGPDGSLVAVSSIRLVVDADSDGDTDDDAEALADAELAIRDIAEASDGPLAGGSLSPAVLAQDSEAATGSEMTLLMVVALVVIAALLLLFTRSVFDLLMTLAGLVMTIIWVTGAQGWLGPEGVGLIGAPTALTSMVPILLIGLVVDYAIQTVGMYREQRNEGRDVAASVRLGLRAVIVPLSLAVVTTVASFLTNLTSPIPANGDFGIVAAIGVASGLIVMLTLLTSSRKLRDRRRESRGTLSPPRPISGAIPGIGPAVESFGGLLARRPVPFLAVVGIVTVLLGAASTRIDTVFDSRDFLPADGEATAHLETLDAAFGGETGSVRILIDAELTDDRTVRNIIDFTEAFYDDLRRPEGVVGGIESSLGLLLIDWVTDDATPGDNYDPELAAIAAGASEFRLDPVKIQALLDRLEQIDPAGFGRVAINNPDGPDTLLVEFQALTGDQERTARMVSDINALWYGPDQNLTAASTEVIGLEVVNAMTDSQTESILTTMLAALIILCLFFWITKRRPALGFIAVAPIVMVLVWVLGTMALIGLPYNVITALITALSIGIGVDYTIHIIHRYEEEFEHSRDPAAAARRTLATTGSALLGSALTTALGFGVLVLSSLTPFQQFGLVTAITIGYALVAAIVVVPPLMIVWAAYQNSRLRSAAARAGHQLVEG